MRESITGHVIANTIRLARDQFAGSFLIVEGPTDARFFKRFVDSNTCKVIPAYGKKNAIVGLSLLEQEKFLGVLAVIDADFMQLEGKLPDSQHLLLTDTHDVETMLIKSPALETVLNEHASETKVIAFIQRTGKDVRERLVESGMPIGYLRWVSLTENLSLKFEDLEFTEFLDRNSLAINVQKLIRSVRNKSMRLDLEESYIRNRMEQMKHEMHDPFHVCCGHDLVCILSFGLRRALASKQLHDVKPDYLEKDLRLSFTFSYFRETQLYSSLQKWEKANPPCLILSREFS
jgi:hypothetical protein